MRKWLSDNVNPLLFPNWGWPLLVLGLVLLAIVYAWWPDITRLVSFSLLVISILAIGGWFLSVFAGKDDVDEKDAHNMLVFCYAFTFLSLLVSISPAIVFLTVPSEYLSTIYLESAQSPLGVVRGCVHVLTEADKEWELACRPSDIYADQWIVNIGGSVLQRALASPCPKVSLTPTATPTAMPTPLPTTTVISGKKQSGSAATGMDPAATPDSNASARKPAGALASTPIVTPTMTSTTAATATATPTATMTTTPTPSGTSASENLTESTDFPPMTIHGGLAVPWYFITLALMGAAVSLARKVPEYQGRVYFTADRAKEIMQEIASAGDQSVSSAPLSPRVLREWLVFQVLQFASSPFIAIAAYHLVKPNSTSTSVALGFVSGFSSEAVLLLIRGAVERMTGVESTKAAQAAKAEAESKIKGAAAAEGVAAGLRALNPPPLPAGPAPAPPAGPAPAPPAGPAPAPPAGGDV